FVRGSSQFDRPALFRNPHAGFKHSVRYFARPEALAHGSPTVPAAGQPHAGEQAGPPSAGAADWHAGIWVHGAPANYRTLLEEPAVPDSSGKGIRNPTCSHSGSQFVG